MSYQPLWQLKDILNWILDYVGRLWFLSEIRDPTTWNIRVTLWWWTSAVTVSSGTVTTVTWVTTVSLLTNQTNIGWIQAQPQIPALMNLEATIWNIDNIIIS